MPNPKLITTPFAETGARNDIPESGASEPQQATMQTGFPQTTATPISEGGIPPEREDFNGMFHLTTSHLSYLNRGLWYEFDATFAGQIGGYPLHARVLLDNGKIAQSTIDGNTNDPNVSATGWIFDNSASSIIDESGLTQQEINDGIKSASALRSMNARGEGERVYLLSVNEGQGEGGGVFVSKNKGSLVDDGGTIFQSANAAIVYVRINFDHLTPEMFGAKGDDASFDNYIALQGAFKHQLPLEIPPKTYYTTRSIWYTSGKKITGSGHQKSVISKTTNSTETDLSTAFAKDAVVIARHWSANDYTHYCEFDGFLVTSTVKCEFGLYAPRIAESSFSNFKIHNSVKGFYSDDAWMISMTRVTSSADRPYIINMGTSITMSSCWAINARGESSYCYEFNNLYYSTLISCGADNNGLDGSPIKGLYRVLNSSITFISCASENNHAYKIFHGQGASVDIVKMTAMRFYNKYKVSTPVWGNENALFDLRSETRLDIQDSAFDGLLNTDTSTSPSWINITDTSYLNYKNIRVNIPITGASLNDTTDFGVKWASATTVILDFGTYKIESCVSLPSNQYNPLPVPTNETYSSIFTRGGIRENSQELSTENLNNLRYLGTTTFKQSQGSEATLANNYPEAGGAWAIQQYSDVSTQPNNANTNTTQIAIRKDSNRMYFRCAPYGGVFTPWYKIYHTGDTKLDAKNIIDSSGMTQQEINNKKLTVDNFGAKGDGITDDSAAFQAYCDSSLTGQLLYLGSKGRYKISKQVDLKGKSIIGAGMGKPSEAYYNLNCIDVDGASPDLAEKTAFINSGPFLHNLTARCSNGAGNSVSFIEIDGYLANIQNITIVNFYNQIVVKEATVGFYVSNWWSYYSQNSGLYCQDPNSRVSTTGMFRNVYFQLGDNYCMIFDKSIVGMNFDNITIESMNGGIKCPSIARCKISNFWCENTKDGTAKKVFDFSAALGSSWGNTVENILTTGTNGSWVDNFSPSKAPENSDLTGVVSTNSMVSVSSRGITVNNKVTLMSTGLYTNGALYEARLTGSTPLVKLRTIGADSSGAAYNASDMYTKTMRKWNTYNHLSNSSGQFIAPMFITYDQSFTTQQDNAGWTIVKESTGVYRVERKAGNTNVMTNPNIIIGSPIMGSRIGNGSIAMSSLQMIESYSGSWTTATEASGFKIFWRDSAGTLVDPWRFSISITLGSGF